jgi:hypothetical protein
MSTSPGLDLTWDRLPDYIIAADDPLFTLRKWLGGVAGQLDPALLILNQADPNTSLSGTCEIANPAMAPRSSDPNSNWLGWLGWLVGIDTTGIDPQFVRQTVSDAVTAQRRGSMGAMVAAIKRTLTGSASVRIYVNITGTDPWLINVITTTSQTPDEAVTLAAAMSEKPAGAILDLTTTDGSIYLEIAANFDDYTELAATFATYTALNQYDAP